MIDMTPLYKFAQAYGRDSAYGRNEYTCGDNQACLAQYENGDTPGVPSTGPGTPNTGFIREQPVLFYGGVIVLAVVLYTLTVFAIKKLRRSNTKG